MSFRYPAGLITASSPVNANYPSGVWTPRQALPYLQNGVWGQDPFFDQTTLLLHGDGTNGAQNNTFLDSSSNNFTITRNGNTTQGTFSPFSVGAGEWSNYFDGTGDYLNLGGQSAFAFGTGDWTIEFWIYATSSGGTLFDTRPSGTASTNGYGVIFLSSGTVRYDTAAAVRITGSISILNTWTHVAVCKASGTTRLFINGVQDGSSYSDSTNYLVGANRPIIGADGNNPAAVLVTGYFSNYRILKGTGLYTSNFTPPTAPLTAITNTSLLTCQSNRFVDNSTNNFAITRNGDVRVTPFSPFQPSLAYSPGVTGGSGYFDGSGDDLRISNDAALNLESGDFTVEAWFYTINTSTNRPIIYRFDGDAGSRNDLQFAIAINSGNLVIAPYSGTTNYDMSFSSVPLNQWNHCALVRTGNNFYAYLNGVRNATTQTISGNLNNGTWETWIGGYREGGAFVYQLGYISNVRILKGTALYTGATYTVPTAPLTAITNTQLLCNFTNAGILDNTAKNNLETVGNAQIDTAVVKYGTGSMEFDGSGDFLSIFATAELQLTNTSAFTIEFWVYATTLPSIGGSAFIIRAYNLSSPFPGYGIAFGGNTANTNLQLWNGTAWADIGTVSATTWTHVAVTYEGSGSTLRYFINGTQQGSATTVPSSINWTGTQFILGARNSDFYFNGYIDDLRITKGIARYTANFVPPIARFPNQ